MSYVSLEVGRGLVGDVGAHSKEVFSYCQYHSCSGNFYVGNGCGGHTVMRQHMENSLGFILFNMMLGFGKSEHVGCG